MKRIFACHLTVIICLVGLLSAGVSRGESSLYHYDSVRDPLSAGWSVEGAGELSTLVSIDGALAAGTGRKPGWLLCDRATNAGAALTYGGAPWAEGANWSVTMDLRWEENAYDSAGEIPTGGNRYFLSGNRQNFCWRVGNGTTGYYEVVFGQQSGSSITASSGAQTQAGVAFASFGEDVSLTLAVVGGVASLFVGDQLVLDQLVLTLSQEECGGMMLGDPTGTAQGCVTLHSVTFLPEPSASAMALAAAASALGRRRRRVALPAGES